MNLQLEIERLQQRNQRLQATGEVTEKAAAEFVDQKMHEVSFLQNELATQLAGTGIPIFLSFCLRPFPLSTLFLDVYLVYLLSSCFLHFVPSLSVVCFPHACLDRCGCTRLYAHVCISGACCGVMLL